MRLGGNILFSVRDYASFKELGKNIASVLDFTLLPLICICIPGCLKCWLRMGVEVSNSSWVSVINMLSPMKKRC
jgi:hypothetical protein